MFYVYVYENNYRKNFNLNQGFKEYCVKKWDIYMKKNECFIFQKLFFMDDYQIQGGFR